jgi:hypothetical protein
MGILRVKGEAFDADQTEELCDGCGESAEFGCICDFDENEGEANEPDEDDLVEFIPRSAWGLTTSGRDGGVWC